MNTSGIFIVALLVSPAISFAQNTPFPKVVNPLGTPKTLVPGATPFAPPVQTAAQKKNANNNKQQPQMPQMPQMPGGGGGSGNPSGQQGSGQGMGQQGTGQQAAGQATGAKRDSQKQSGDSQSGSGKSQGDDGLCTQANQNTTQMRGDGCKTLDSVLENDCPEQKLEEITKKAADDGKGISDMNDYCANYKDLPPTKKQEMFKQIMAAIIKQNSDWKDGKLMKVSKADVQQNQMCHNADSGGAKENLQCGTCVALTKIAQSGKIADGLGQGVNKDKVKKAVSGFCTDAGKGGPTSGPNGAPPAAVQR